MKAKKKAFRVRAWAIKHTQEPRPFTALGGILQVYDTRKQAVAFRNGKYPTAPVIPVEIRELPAKKAGGGRKK